MADPNLITIAAAHVLCSFHPLQVAAKDAVLYYPKHIAFRGMFSYIATDLTRASKEVEISYGKGRERAESSRGTHIIGEPSALDSGQGA